MSSVSKVPVLLMARELHIGGSERQMTEVAKRLDRSVFVAHVGCFRPAGVRGDELRDSGVSIVQFPIYSYRSPATVREAGHLVRYIRAHGIQIVHAWDYPLNVYAIPIARAMTRSVAISSQRAHRDLCPIGYRRLLKLSDRMSHAIVANCEYVRRHLIDERVPEQKIQVCYNGIDLDTFQRRCGVAHSLTIGVVCALRPEKDLCTLIDAFGLIRNVAPGLKLVIVGSGEELPRLQHRASEAGQGGVSPPLVNRFAHSGRVRVVVRVHPSIIGALRVDQCKQCRRRIGDVTAKRNLPLIAVPTLVHAGRCHHVRARSTYVHAWKDADAGSYVAVRAKPHVESASSGPDARSAIVESDASVSERLNPAFAVNVHDDEARRHRDADVRVGPALPPLADDPRVRRGIVEPVRRARMLANVCAVGVATRAQAALY